MIKMIKTASRAYPKGKVPKDFKNWLIKINQYKKKKIFKKRIFYVDSFPMRKEIQYKEEVILTRDMLGNVVYTNHLKRIY